MAIQQEGIVLSSTRYGENRLIVNIFTPEYGTLGFIATLAKKSKTGLKPAHFQNLQILEFSFAEKSKGSLKRIQEARIPISYQSLYFDPIRSCLSLFLAEFLQKVLKEEEPHEELFHFVKQALIQLDRAEGGVANFHLAFLMDLSAYLGFSPQLDDSQDAAYFDLLEGGLRHTIPEHPHYIQSAEIGHWREIKRGGTANFESLALRSSSARRQILERMIDYYRLQLNDFGPMKSLAILKEVLA